jgi:hypothetical protein
LVLRLCAAPIISKFINLKGYVHIVNYPSGLHELGQMFRMEKIRRINRFMPIRNMCLNDALFLYGGPGSMLKSSKFSIWWKEPIRFRIYHRHYTYRLS